MRSLGFRRAARSRVVRRVAQSRPRRSSSVADALHYTSASTCLRYRLRLLSPSSQRGPASVTDRRARDVRMWRPSWRASAVWTRLDAFASATTFGFLACVRPYSIPSRRAAEPRDLSSVVVHVGVTNTRCITTFHTRRSLSQFQPVVSRVQSRTELAASGGSAKIQYPNWCLRRFLSNKIRLLPRGPGFLPPLKKSVRTVQRSKKDLQYLLRATKLRRLYVVMTCNGNRGRTERLRSRNQTRPRPTTRARSRY